MRIQERGIDLKKKWLVSFLIFMAVVLLVIEYSFHIDINKEVMAYIYVDGMVVGETTLKMNGNIKKSLFSNEQTYVGTFQIQYYERTIREDMQAKIKWYNTPIEEQTIHYNQNASFPLLELKSDLLIDYQMDEIALGFVDGTVIATSKEMYITYRECLLD